VTGTLIDKGTPQPIRLGEFTQIIFEEHELAVLHPHYNYIAKRTASSLSGCSQAGQRKDK
jgi:hypothetical protein